MYFHQLSEVILIDFIQGTTCSRTIFTPSYQKITETDQIRTELSSIDSIKSNGFIIYGKSCEAGESIVLFGALYSVVSPI